MKKILLCFLLKTSILCYCQTISPLIPFTKDGKWGFADTNMNMVVPPIYDRVLPLMSGHASIIKDNLYGMIDSTGMIVIPLGTNCFNLFDTVCWTLKNGQWTIRYRSGKEVIPPHKYGEPVVFNEGMSRVRRDNKYGFVNKLGKEIIPCIYDSSDYSFHEGLVPMRLGQYWAFFDKNGLQLTPFKYIAVLQFNEGTAVVRDSALKYGFINKLGKEIIPPQFEDVNIFSDGMAMAQVNGKIGFIDTSGRFIIRPEFTYCGGFSEGFVYVAGTNFLKTKLYNKKGKCVMSSYRFDDIEEFSHGLASVSNLLGKYGYIDTTGKRIVRLKYDYTGNFVCGLGMVERKKKFGFVNIKGKIVIPLIYDDAYEFDKGIVKVKRNEKEFYIDIRGREYIAW